MGNLFVERGFRWIVALSVAAGLIDFDLWVGELEPRGAFFLLKSDLAYEGQESHEWCNQPSDGAFAVVFVDEDPLLLASHKTLQGIGVGSSGVDLYR